MASERFWNASKSIIDKTEKHPFLTSMVDGTLSKDKFIYYVIQDALYLTDFADCLKRLGDSLPTNTSDSNSNSNSNSNAADKERLYSLAKGAEEDEKELHRSFFTKWGISSTTNTNTNTNDSDNTVEAEAMPKTLLYTSYMLRVVTTRPYVEGLAVLLPCFWVYMHVGKCMLKLRDELGDR